VTTPDPGQVATTEPPVLKPSDLARRWSISPRTVLNLLTRGRLPGTQIGRQWRVTEADECPGPVGSRPRAEVRRTT
jgi:excisionase family DNA binding protein